MQDMLIQCGLGVIELILVAIVGWLGTIVKNWLEEKQLTGIAKTVVSAVEQIYTDIHGEDKLNKALEMFSVLLKKKGIKIDAEQMKILIESAVGEFNGVFNKTEAKTENCEWSEVCE